MKGILAVAAIWIALGALWFFTVAPSATGQAAPDPAYTALEERVAALEAANEVSPLAQACDTAVNLGAAQNLAITKCRRVAEVTLGKTTLVTVHVLVAGQGWFHVALTLYRSPYVQTNLVISPG